MLQAARPAYLTVPIAPAPRSSSSSSRPTKCKPLGALIGGWEIGVTMDEIPFAGDAAVDMRDADSHRGVALAIEKRFDRKPLFNPAPAPTCMSERENM